LENEDINLKTEGSVTEEVRIAEVFKHKKKELINKIENRAASVKVKKIDTNSFVHSLTPKNRRNKNNSLHVERSSKGLSQSVEKLDKKHLEPNKRTIERLIHGEKIQVNFYFYSKVKQRRNQGFE
jgi:hypothetical protein